MQSLPGTVRVVNPAWRKLDVAVRKTRQAERRLQAKVAMSSVQDGAEMQKKAESVEAMQAVHEEFHSSGGDSSARARPWRGTATW